MEERRAAARDLERIRALMERAGRFSNLSGYSAVVAGALAAAGAVACRALGVNFNNPACAGALAAIWGTVLVLALAQAVAFTIVKARRRAEPAWSHLTQQVVMAMLPAAFVGAAITGYGLQTRQLDLLPPIWMLAYGSSLMGLGLFAGPRIKLVAALFLFLGAAALFWWKDYGLRMMLLAFGGLHVFLGAWVLWKSRASAA